MACAERASKRRSDKATRWRDATARCDSAFLQLVKATDLDFLQVRFLLGEQLVRPFRELCLAAGVPNAPKK